MIDDNLTDIAIRHQVYLERLKAGLVTDMAKSIDQVEKDLIARIKAVDVKLVGDLGVGQFNTMLKDLKAVEYDVMSTGSENLVKSLDTLSATASRVEAKSIGNLIDNVERLTVPEASAVFRAVLKNPISATGDLLLPFVDSMTPNQLKKTEALMRRAYTEGWTVQQAVQGVRGTPGKNFKDGITAIKKRQAEAVVRTSVQHTANAARQVTWTANADIITGYQWLSTLDSKTTPQCQALDGQKFKLNKGPTPPIHVNCRSTTIPSLSEEFDFLDEGETRSALFGPVAGDTQYFDWLKKQDRSFIEETLGKERASLFLDKGLTPEQFRALSLDKRFMPLTNAEMRAKLQGDLLAAPAPGTKTGQLWTLADDMKSRLGRVPTPAEFLSETRAQGFNDATAKTQLAKWKKESGGVKPIVTPPPPVVRPPVVTPPPTTTTVGRVGMPGKGATRQVWELSDELEVKLNRIPTRAELLAETRKLGINDSTAGTQYGKWKNAPKSGAPVTPKPTVAPVPAPTAQALKDARWAELDKQLDLAVKPELSKSQLYAKSRIDAIDEQINTRRKEIDRYFKTDPDNGWRVWTDDAPEELVVWYQQLEKNRRVQYSNFRLSATPGNGPRDAIHKLLAIPPSEKGKLSVNLDSINEFSTGGRANIKAGIDEIERYTHKSILDAVSTKGEMSFIDKGPGARASFSIWDMHANLRSLESVTTVVHEIAHAFEYVRPDIAKRTAAFIKSRAAGESLKKLNTVDKFYADHEVFYEDKWRERGGSHYMGRHYAGQDATEIITMGFERFISDPVAFREKDKEYFDLIVRILQDL